MFVFNRRHQIPPVVGVPLSWWGGQARQAAIGPQDYYHLSAVQISSASGLQPLAAAPTLPLLMA